MKVYPISWSKQETNDVSLEEKKIEKAKTIKTEFREGNMQLWKLEH